VKAVRRCGGGWALLGLVLVTGLPTPAFAQVQRNFLNPGFESPSLTATNPANGCFKLLSETLVPGWTTTHPSGGQGGDCTAPASPNGPLMELWRTGFQGVAARAGLNFVELNAAASSRMYQNVCLINGDRIVWRFSHRGRGSASIRDVMDYNIGASSPIVRVGTTSNGAFDAPITTLGTANVPTAGGNGWVDYSGVFIHSGASGTTTMGFESISTGSGSNTVGNFLDNIQIELTPFVEFLQPGSASSEGTSGNLPTLRVSGTVFAPFTVSVQITGGTATLGTDYTTPGNSSTMTLTIPVGQYDGTSSGSLFALPITVIDDALAEGNETILLSIIPPSGSPVPYLLSSSATCGGAGQAAWTYNITDNDASLAITKNVAAPVAVSGQPTQFDVAYTIVVNNPTTVAANYSLVDAPGFDADVSIVSAGFTLNGGPTTALAGSGPWTLQAPSRTLVGGASDTYVVTVRFNVNRGGSVANDACASPGAPGSGLYNAATATLQSGANPTFAASACASTPTPVWVTLRKVLTGRAVATDQVQIRIRSAGVTVATATTSGTTVPTTAATAVLVVPPGNTLQFEESVKANGTGADQAPANYRPQIACSNATAGASTVLPNGSGSAVSTRQEWPAFTPGAGDDIDCVITNDLPRADLRLVKTNTPGVNGEIDQGADTVVSGSAVGYTITVTNLGPDAANGAVITDPAPNNLTCSTATCAASGGAACPVPTGAALVAALQGAGATVPTLPNGGAVVITLNCTVD
jgi:uncharacterized repeat protein (TIGR01451 family)